MSVCTSYLSRQGEKLGLIQLQKAYEVASFYPSNDQWPTCVRQALAFIHLHLWGLDDKLNYIARHVKSFNTHTRHHFRACLGSSIKAYIQYHRLNFALQALAYTACPIQEIEEACGFRGAAAFCNAFKRKYGVSPTVWREENKLTICKQSL